METYEIACFAVGILLAFAVWYWVRGTLEARNECECKDIMECQAEQLAGILKHHNSESLFKTISSLRFLPDKSGYFVIMDYEGTIYAHGGLEWSGKEKTLPICFPTSDIVNVAKNGGGYVKYEHEGRQNTMYIVGVPEQRIIVCSNLPTDSQSVRKRQRWRMIQKNNQKNHTKNGKVLMAGKAKV